jgi:hypothetical protein
MILWGGFSGLCLWVTAVTNHTIRNLTRFQIRVQPMHPDGLGGLRPLGDLFTTLGLIILLFCIPLAVLGLSGTRDLVTSQRCLDRLTTADEVVLPMGKDEVGDCLTAITRASLYGSYQTDKAVQEIREAVSRGDTRIELVEQMTREFLEKEYNGHSLRDHVFRRNRLPLIMVAGLFLVLLVVGVLFLRPLWTVHHGMVESREHATAYLARVLTDLHCSLSQEVEKHQWEKAQATGEKLKLVQTLRDVTAAAPSWPFSYPAVLREYVMPALLSAGLSYALTYFDTLLPPKF